MDWPLEVWIERAQARRRSPRDRLIDLVRFGKLKPEQAEAWARDRGLPPFVEEPAADAFDPMQERLWTLPMTVAWLIWRTPRRPRQCWHEFRAECWDWQRRLARLPRPKWPGGWRIYDGHELCQLDPLTPSGVLRLALFPGGRPAVLDPENAERELMDALCDGRLTARATMTRIDIPAREWVDLSPFTEPVGKGAHDAVFLASESAPKFAAVRVERAKVMDLWPAGPREQRPAKRGRREGSGSFVDTDAPLLEEAKRRIQSGEQQGHVLSELALKAAGSGTLESKETRLRKRLSERKESGDK